MNEYQLELLDIVRHEKNYDNSTILRDTEYIIKKSSSHIEMTRLLLKVIIACDTYIQVITNEAIEIEKNKLSPQPLLVPEGTIVML